MTRTRTARRIPAREPSPARNVYLFKGTTQVGSPILTGSSFSFGAQDVGATYTVCVASVTGEVQTYPKSNTPGHGDCSSVSRANPVGWQFQLTSDGNTTLGFGSLDATAGSCSEPFGNAVLSDHAQRRGSVRQEFVVSYSDTDSNKSAELRPWGAAASSQWSNTSSGRCPPTARRSNCSTTTRWTTSRRRRCSSARSIRDRIRR